MSRAVLILAVTSALLCVLAIHFVRSWHRATESSAFEAREDKASRKVAQEDASPSLDTHPSKQTVDAKHIESVKEGINAIFGGLQSLGGKQPSPSEHINEALAKGERSELREAFHEAMYGRFAKMTESIAALQKNLEHPDPYVQFLAAEHWLFAESSG